MLCILLAKAAQGSRLSASVGGREAWAWVRAL